MRSAFLWGLFLTGCTSAEEHTCPSWWEYTPSGIHRLHWIGTSSLDSIQQAEQTVPYYRDSLGLVFRHRLPTAGLLWVEYFYQRGTVLTLSFTIEEVDFSQIVRLYTQLRQCYTQRYGKPKGAVGALTWQTADSLLLYLGLSPERNYLHATFSKLLPL